MVSALPEKKHYEGVQFKVISVTRGGWGSNFGGGGKHYAHLNGPCGCL